jgi:hypothetical protein
VTDAPRTALEFVAWLVARHPGLAPLLDECLRDNGELLPHVLFRRREEICVDASPSSRTRRSQPPSQRSGRCACALDDSDDEVDNLISVSLRCTSVLKPNLTEPTQVRSADGQSLDWPAPKRTGAGLSTIW